ncbi:MAG: hypothetical protein WC413_01865 [Candidatus Nanoarchaeia archaeon]
MKKMQFWEDKSDIVQKLAWEEWKYLKEELNGNIILVDMFSNEGYMYSYLTNPEMYEYDPERFKYLLGLKDTLDSKLIEEYQSRKDLYLKDVKRLIENGYNDFKLGDFKINLPITGGNKGLIHCKLKTSLYEGNQQLPKNILKNVKRFISQDDFMKREGYKTRKEMGWGCSESSLSCYYPIEPTVKEMERLFKTMNELYKTHKF